MKKFSFLFAALCMALTMSATEVTVTIGDYAAANGWANSVQQTSLTMDEVVTVTANPTTGTYNNTGKYYDSGKNWRMYQNEAPAITVSAAEGYLLTSVTFTYESNKTGVMVDADGAQVASAEAYALDNVASATFSVSNTNADVTNGQARITAITVVYEAAVVEPTTETVYFVNNKGWENVNVYAWDPANAGWPGVAATKEAEQIGGYDVYSYTAEAGAYANVIFNNGSGDQTADLVWTAGKYVVNNQWYTKEEAEAQLAKPIEYESVYFVDNQGWGKANIYTWTPEVGTWPGVAMTKEAEQLAGYDVYSYTVEKGTSFGGVIFNNGSSQTSDLVWTAGKYYVKDGWYTKEEAIEKLSAPVTPPVITYVLMGVKGDWTTGIAMTVNPDNANEYVLLGQEILEGDSVKVVTLTDGVATAWCGNVDEYSPVEYTNAEGNGNIVLKPGKYDFYYKVAEDLIYIGAAEPAIEWIEMPLEISNLTTMEMPVEGVTYLQLTGRDDMNDADVMLFLNNYTGEEKAYEVNVESSYMTFGGMELTVMDGSITKSVDPELGDVYAGIVHASVEEDGATMYVEFTLKMYALAPVAIELEDVEIVVNEESAIAFFNATWEGSPLQVEVSGFEEVEFKEYPECWLSIGDDVNWVDAAAGPAAIIIEDGVASLEGEFTSFSTGKTYEVMLSGKLPVKEEPVVEPTYTENNLNPYAFGLESVLSDDKTTLTVTYRLNNSNATSVNVLVYNGEDIVASVPGTTTIGKNTVEVVTGNLPAGVELKWAVEVNGTSVEAPTQDEKMFSLYCPHGLAIDTDPESENFGRILVAEAMQGVPASGYVTSGKGAGLYVFNPSFTTDSVVYTGGNDFTRILASNGYQPWRVKISEDGRIFVSSLDLNGVVVWEVSKDLQTWTPVIAGTNDATDHNIYDAEGNFVAGLNCSMDVIGSGEDLKLLLYSTNNKGIAFNQSGYRLDEYALGTATTWTGTPKNILEGGKLGLVHTNVEFIYDGEGGYWFGASRAGNAGQPNLVHINAAGEQDYYTEDASLYGGDGVLVHNGMLFKGKARTSSTVGNFGVWTIGKDADGKVTLTEKWTVEANGIGRNLNEFAVDYAENLYIVGNSGEKIIAYALPYSGQVETPAGAKYAFQLPEPLKMAGVVKRAVQNGDAVIVLTHEENGAAHIYQVVDGKAVAEVSLEGVLPVDTENPGSYLAISDIAVTEDGKLVANNYNRCSFNDGVVESGYKRGTLTFYIWNDLAAAPAIWFQSKASSNSNNSDQGYTMALTGTSTNANILVSGVHNTQRGVRMSHFSVVDGVFEDTQDGAANLPYYYYIGSNFKGASAGADAAVFNEQTQGANLQFHASPLADENWIIDGELTNPIEFTNPQVHGGEVVVKAALTEDLGKKYNGATYVTVGEKVLMVAPFANPDGELVGAEILNITNGFDAPQYVDMVYVDEAVAATAAATAVEVVEGGLNITLVADNAIHTWFVEMSEGPVYEVYEEEITNLVIDLDNLVLMGGPGSAFQVEVYLPLGEYNMSEDSYQLTSESSIAVLGSDATFIEGYAYEVDAFTPSAKAVVRCEWNGMLLEFRLTMTAAPLEPTVVVVENAAIEIEKYLLWGDMYDYALKMSGEWVNPEDGLTYPVLVEVPVYYPEATEPSEIMSTVTVGGNGEDDPWLGFGEGTLTVTTETLSAGDKLITATGIVQNPMAGVAIDITISGSITPTGVENATVTVKSVKMIQNGQLIIKKGDAQYNAQGATLK